MLIPPSRVEWFQPSCEWFRGLASSLAALPGNISYCFVDPFSISTDTQWESPARIYIYSYHYHLCLMTRNHKSCQKESLNQQSCQHAHKLLRITDTIMLGLERPSTNLSKPSLLMWMAPQNLLSRHSRPTSLCYMTRIETELLAARMSREEPTMKGPNHRMETLMTESGEQLEMSTPMMNQHPSNPELIPVYSHGPLLNKLEAPSSGGSAKWLDDSLQIIHLTSNSPDRTSLIQAWHLNSPKVNGKMSCSGYQSTLMRCSVGVTPLSMMKGSLKMLGTSPSQPGMLSPPKLLSQLETGSLPGDKPLPQSYSLSLTGEASARATQVTSLQTLCLLCRRASSRPGMSLRNPQVTTGWSMGKPAGIATCGSELLGGTDLSRSE